MADANLNTRTPVTERFVTIQQSQRESRNWNSPIRPLPYPWLRLGGRWMQLAGFSPGQRVKINVEQRRLTITAE